MAGIVHKNVKASGDKGLATEWNDDHRQTGNHDCEKHQHLNHVIENRTDFPAGPVEGQIVYRTDLDVLYVYDGSDWKPYSTENLMYANSTVLCGGDFGSITTGGLDFGSVDYMPIVGVAEPTGAEKVYIIVPRSGTLRNFYVRVMNNTLNNTTIISIYKNDVTTNLSVSYLAGATGLKSDTTHTISVSAGDRICVELDASTYESDAGRMYRIYASCEFID